LKKVLYIVEAVAKTSSPCGSKGMIVEKTTQNPFIRMLDSWWEYIAIPRQLD
jgi:hypothetical protein